MIDALSAVTVSQWYLGLAAVLVSAGLIRMFLVTDHVARLVAMNVLGSGTLLTLVALAARSTEIDPVLSALVITGLVITVAFTGVAAVLIRRIEAFDAEEGDQ